jgi:muramoyltetrapeptide carboxypeptidase
VKIKPPPLRPGDGIGIIAPSGPVTRSEIKPAIDLLTARGYHVLESPHIYSRQDYLAGHDDHRLKDLHSVFHDQDIKAVLCARGGYGTLRLLDRIDYILIRKHPKIIVGYSDITALLLAIYKKTGLVTFHGPVLKDISKDRRKNLDAFLDLASSPEHYSLKLSDGEVLTSGKSEGLLIGGNLTLISHLTGTPFMASLKGAILFLEERGEPLYRIDRMLSHLRLSGLLKNLAGLVAGEFVDCGDTSEINRLLKEITSNIGIPVFSGLPVGHDTLNLSIPLGVKAVLDTTNRTLSALEPCLAV